MIYLKRIQDVIFSSWGIALILTIIFYFTHGYMYAWDDQRHEIPLLKSLINPNLFTRDHFVHSLQVNLTTYFYFFLSKIISIDQIERTYESLFFISRYFMFFWMYKLWEIISKNKFIAFLCVATFLLLTRYQMFFYFSFSHAEFAFAFIFAGLYFFYKEQFIRAAVILGIASNIHALLAAIIMSYILVYLLFTLKKHGSKILGQALGFYVMFAFPVLIWYAKKVFFLDLSNVTPLPVNWPELYRELTPFFFMFGPQSLGDLFPTVFKGFATVQFYLFLMALYVLNFCHNTQFREEKKNHIIFGLSMMFLVVSFISCYIYPQNFLLKLQLYRYESYLLFILIGYTTITLLKRMECNNPFLGFFIGLGYFTLSEKNLINVIYLAILIALLYLPKVKHGQIWLKRMALSVFIGFCVWGLINVCEAIRLNPFRSSLFQAGVVLMAVVSLLRFIPLGGTTYKRVLAQAVLVLPLLVYVYGYANRHLIQEKKEKTQVEILQDDWKVMSEYVKGNTATDTLFLIPYDMPFHNFRIYGERSVIFSQSDLAILTFDRSYLDEYFKRIKDIGAFRMITKEPVKDAIVNAIAKYNVDYIIFPQYNSPASTQTMTLIHKTNFLSLYKINYD